MEKVTDKNSKKEVLRCDICNIVFADKTVKECHLAGKKHMKKVQWEEFQQKLIENSVFIVSPPNLSKDDLIAFLRQFGTIKKYFFGQRHLIVEYTNRETAQYLLSQPIWYKNYILKIHKRHLNTPERLKKSEIKTSEDITTISYEKVKSCFDKMYTFEDQLEAFRRAIELSPDEINARYESTRSRLHVIFKTMFPKCVLCRFGSTVTELGFKDCDLDLYLNIGEPLREEKSALPHEWTAQRVFRDVKTMMYKMNVVFSNVVPIPRAKIPIIKFLYIPTQVFCDISFKNSLAGYNNNFIKYCLALDVRLKPLMVIIKYWAKHYTISGTGRMTSYALIMLTIFYLQQPHVAMVPTLIELQKTCVPYCINGWQVNFDEKTVLPVISNDSSIPQLLHGFFSFYANFNFEANVICPLDGKIRPRQDFDNLDELPSYMDRYKNYINGEEGAEKLNNKRPMCVQDPIELSHNITACMSIRVVEMFRDLSIICAQICVKSAADDYKNLLPTLFTVRPQKQSEFKITISVTNVVKYGLPEDFETRTDIVDKDKFIKDKWLVLLFNLVKETFEKVLLLNVEVLCYDKETKQQKVATLSDVHTQDHEKVSLHCTGSQYVGVNRKQNAQILDPGLSRLEKEALISQEVIKEQEKQGNNSAVSIDFMCKYEMNEDKRQIVLTVTDVKCSEKLFNNLKSFLLSIFPKVIHQTLMHIKQYNKY